MAASMPGSGTAAMARLKASSSSGVGQFSGVQKTLRSFPREKKKEN
jgi:hypothetical protein